MSVGIDLAPIEPQNIDAEETLLGALMLSPLAIDTVTQSTKLTASDFYLASHRLIYKAILGLYAKGEPADAITVVDDLRTRGQLDAVAIKGQGGEERVHELATLVPAASNAPHYARIVHDEARRRQAITSAQEIVQLAYDRAEPATLESKFQEAHDALRAVCGAAASLTISTIEEFVAVDEPGKAALVGDADAALIPVGADVMLYGDGGAGKTTLSIDLACHLAAGDDWLGFTIAAPVRVLLIENEGPRPRFRLKLEGKLDAWTGSPLNGRLHALEDPWGEVSFADEPSREALAEAIGLGAIDVVIVGPVTRSGMDEAGTLQEVREFMALVADVRRRSQHPVTFVLIHHENKGGKVSGAWEGSGDTLFHQSGKGPGKTRLHIQKARWSSTHHGTSLDLLWTDGEGFLPVDSPTLEVDVEQLADQILNVVTASPGVNWTGVAADAGRREPAA